MESFASLRTPAVRQSLRSSFCPSDLLQITDATPEQYDSTPTIETEKGTIMKGLKTLSTLGIIFAILWLPFGIIFELTKKHS